MNCADCQTALTPIDFRGIKMDECPSCGGCWFSRDALQRAKDNTDEDLHWLDFDPFSEKANRFTIATEHKSCPQCAKEMSSLAYEKSGVIINKCQSCHGVWLHFGEFKKIIDYLEAMVTEESSVQYAIESVKQLLEVVQKRGDKSAEVKDFLVVLKLLKLRFAAEHPQLTQLSRKIYEYLPFL